MKAVTIMTTTLGALSSTGSSESPPLKVGFIGLGDQGLPMASAIADHGFELHVWARRPESLAPLAGTPHIAHDRVASLAGQVDVVALCIGTDEDVLRIVEDDLLAALRPGSIIVNHGTGTPANARRLARVGAAAGVEVVDAPVSGGRPAAEARTLTVLAGGSGAAIIVATPVFASFATHVVHLGGAGTGQMAKLFNNALLMMNQAAIADVLELATRAGLNASDLVDALRLGSADSRALQLMNTMVNPDTVEHLSQVEALDMELFDQAMSDADVDASAATARGLAGANRLSEVIDRLNL
jgi:3-hydroxyisobutyrate dehydrogenase-like beta-hydroxyacid dehydrogenase